MEIELGDRILPIASVTGMTGLSKTTIWRLSKQSEFPQSLRLSPGQWAGPNEPSYAGSAKKPPLLGWSRSHECGGPRTRALRPPIGKRLDGALSGARRPQSELLDPRSPRTGHCWSNVTPVAASMT